MADSKIKCLVVFEPKNKHNYKNRRRFLITLNTMSKYIGEKNAQALKFELKEIRTDKHTRKYRSHGKIEIYWK